MLKNVKLKPALFGNSIFSGISGITTLILMDPLNQLIGISEPLVLPILGVGLILFAGTIVFHATRKVIDPMQVKLIIVQDLLWVVGSVVILSFQMFGLTHLGYILIGVIAIAVADFTFLQYHGLKNYRAS